MTKPSNAPNKQLEVTATQTKGFAKPSEAKAKPNRVTAKQLEVTALQNESAAKPSELRINHSTVLYVTAIIR
jgi:hypothetical protein